MGSSAEKDVMVELYSTIGHFLNSTNYLYWINVITFLFYVIDKFFCVLGCRKIRIPEWWLLFSSGVGGAPSAMLAGWTLNHKTRKESYRSSFNFIVILHIVITCAPFFYGKEYRHLYSQLLLPGSITKRSFGALYYYVPFYGIAMGIYYMVGPLVVLASWWPLAWLNLLQIIFSPIIFIVNLIVSLVRFVLLVGLCGAAIAIALNAYQNPDNMIAYLRQQWNSGIKMLEKL